MAVAFTNGPQIAARLGTPPFSQALNVSAAAQSFKWNNMLARKSHPATARGSRSPTQAVLFAALESSWIASPVQGLGEAGCHVRAGSSAPRQQHRETSSRVGSSNSSSSSNKRSSSNWIVGSCMLKDSTHSPSRPSLGYRCVLVSGAGYEASRLTASNHELPRHLSNGAPSATSGLRCCAANRESDAASADLKLDEKVASRHVGGVITATRVSEDGSTVRVLGPGVESPAGMAKILTVDEFFVAPNCGPIPFPGSAETPLESIVYYLDDDDDEEEAEEEDGVGGKGGSEGLRRLEFDVALGGEGGLNGAGLDAIGESRHGVQVQIASSIRLMQSPSEVGTEAGGRNERGWSGSGPSVGNLMAMTHVRESSGVLCLTIDELNAASGGEEGEEEGGGGFVRIVAGQCGGVSAPPPLTDLLFLDVTLRPGSSIALPIPSNYGALLYILEGVGLVGRSRGPQPISPAFQNEGHALWLPQVTNSESSISEIHVRAHEWSILRFLVIGAE